MEPAGPRAGSSDGGVGGAVRVADWKPWDDRYGPMLSGQAFTDLPRSGQPVGHFFLPYNLMWPSDMRSWQKPEYRTEHLRISAEFRKHLAAKGWTKPQYQIYYNHKEHYNFFPWNLDEPTRQEDLDALSYLGKILTESFPAKDPVQVEERKAGRWVFHRLAQGELAAREIPVGNGIALGRVRARLAGLPAPRRYRLVARTVPSAS